MARIPDEIRILVGVCENLSAAVEVEDTSQEGTLGTLYSISHLLGLFSQDCHIPFPFIQQDATERGTHVECSRYPATLCSSFILIMENRPFGTSRTHIHMVLRLRLYCKEGGVNDIHAMTHKFFPGKKSDSRTYTA